MAKPSETAKIVYLEAVLLPNGEIISEGKTIGWIDTLMCVADVIEVRDGDVIIEKISREH
jgi:hypothetical protein